MDDDAETAPGERRFRLSIVTSGNYFANLCLKPLLSDPAYEVVVFVTTGLHRQRGNRLLEGLTLLRTWGVRYFSYKSFMIALPSLVQPFTRRPLTVSETCKRWKISVHRVRNLNAPDAVSVLAASSPDLLISVSCPYRIRQHVLSVPRFGCMNVHSSLLPAYAGVSTYVHVLANGETTTGMTVHEMVEEFDAGRIIAQRSIGVPPKTSVFRVFQELCNIGGTLLKEAVEQCVAAGEIVGFAQDPSKRSYFGKPASADIARLRRNGHRLMRFADVLDFVRGQAQADSPDRDVREPRRP